MTAPKVPSFTEAELDAIQRGLRDPSSNNDWQIMQQAADALQALRRDYASYKRDARQMEEALRARLDESRRERVPHECNCMLRKNFVWACPLHGLERAAPASEGGNDG